MAIKNNIIKEPRQRRYVARDFDSFRSQLVEYARQYYPDKIQDFSENGLGGMFVDLAAYVGDNLSFYLDHQFQELDPETAFEEKNIERHIKSAGVPIIGAAPANVSQTFYVQIPAKTLNGSTDLREDAIPVIKAGSTVSSDGGISFNLTEDIDFNLRNDDGSYVATQRIGKVNSNGIIQTYVLSAKGSCTSGVEATDRFTINGSFVPFRRLTLTNPNITEIISVSDTLGNQYYEVSSLTDDVVYQNIPNIRDDVGNVPQTIKLIPAPYRFIKDVDISSRRTTLIFGGGSAETLDDDIIPDPSEFAIKYTHRKTFSREPLNPARMLTTNTLGVAAIDCDIFITYRHGGGLSHNASAGEIRTVDKLVMFFPKNPSPAISSLVRSSVETVNEENARDGDDPLTIDELKTLIPSIRASQERLVTRPDLISRVYAIPSNFGRVYRAAARSNTVNPLSTLLYIVSRDKNGNLAQSSDSLKMNLVKYLNPYRMISDSIDIMDSQIINIELTFEVMIDPLLNKQTVLQQALNRLNSFFRVQNFHIDQPIIIEEVRNSITAVRGIISLNALNFTTLVGTVANRTYSDRTFDISSNTYKDVIFPPEGGIFEMKYPNVNIIGKAI
jgi:hypothetical protein